MNLKNRTLFITLFLMLIGCSTPPNPNLSEAESQFATAIPINDMNKSISIVLDSQAQSFSLDTKIPLIIENKSSHRVSLDTNSHVRLFINTGNEWVEVKNAMTYSGDATLAPRDTPLLNLQYTWVEPLLDGIDLGTNNSVIPLRIAIIGEAMDGDLPTGNQVGAYVDVFLNTQLQSLPTEGVLYSKDETLTANKGKIEGIITSADGSGMPLSEVMVFLKYHPLFTGSDQTTAISTTKTDTQGRFSFDAIEPGVYAIQTTITTDQGKTCQNFDLSKFIRIEAGILATLNFSLTC